MHCNVNASGPLGGDQPDRRDEGGNEVVGSKGDQLGEIESKGGRDGIRISDRHGRGVGTEHSKWGERLK